MALTNNDILTEAIGIIGSFPFFSGNYQLDQTQVDRAIEQALRRLSRDRPRELVANFTGDSGNYYILTGGSPVIASWDVDESSILRIDYDSSTRISADEIPNPLSQDDGDWEIFKDASGTYIYFPNHSPSSSVTITVTYTAPYSDVSQVNDAFKWALIYSTIFYFLSTAWLRREKEPDSPAGAEFTLRSRGSGIAEVVRRYEALYNEEIGGSDMLAPAFVQIDSDNKFTTGHDYIFHGKRTR